MRDGVRTQTGAFREAFNSKYEMRSVQESDLAFSDLMCTLAGQKSFTGVSKSKEMPEAGYGGAISSPCYSRPTKL
jgi:hypothetical protein